MGLRISVYRDSDGHDSTNGGISSRFKNLTVVNADGPFESTDDAPAVLMEEGYRSTVRLVPAIKVNDQWVAAKQPNVVGPMFGGNYGATSDSRFRKSIENLTGGSFYGAVAIHDRFETQAQYDILSR